MWHAENDPPFRHHTVTMGNSLQIKYMVASRPEENTLVCYALVGAGNHAGLGIMWL